MRVAAAISEHPLPTHAVGEAAGEVLDRIGQHPDLALVLVTGNHAGALEDIAATVTAVLRPATTLGAGAASVIGGPREVEQQPAVVVWAAHCGRATPVRVRSARMDEGWSLTGLPQLAAHGRRTLLLLGDPHSFPAEGFLEELHGTCPDLTVVGGLTSGALGPGGSRLVLDSELHTSGAIGVLFEPDADLEARVSQGSRPIGDPFVVTSADGPHLLELGGRSAVERLRELLADLDVTERAAASTGLQMGIVIDESLPTFERGDFVVRRVVGADLRSGAVGVGEPVEVGQTVQFHLSDATAAHADLDATLAGTGAAGALVFTCTARGRRLFGRPDHDAELISETLGTRAVAGAFTAGEIGPVGGRSLLHGSSTSVLLFRPRAA